jgi:sugar transferase (PEP-CTERM/EpsH1 system associated)
MSPPRPLIAHAVHRFDVGGMENGLANLINGLPESFADHAVIAFTEVNPAFARRIRRERVQLIELHKPPGQTLRIAPRLWSLLRRLKPVVFHTRNLATLEAQAVAWAAGVPFRVHGEHGWDMGDLDGSNRRHRHLRQLMRPFVHHQIALSLPTQRYLTEQVGVSPERVTNLCNGVDTAVFAPAPDRAQARRQLPGFDLPADAFVVSAVGRFAAVKNLPMLIDAFARVRARNPAFAQHARLALVGDGPERERIDASLATHGLDAVTWLPGARADVADCLRCADLLCLPSLAEGISNAVLEAMASGLPVIATDVGGNAELIADQDSGWLVPSGDAEAMAAAIERYFSNSDLLHRHSAAARQRAVTQFSLAGMVQGYHRVYSRFISERH